VLDQPWLLVREILHCVRERQGWGAKFESGTIFATPLANLQADFRRMPLPLRAVVPTYTNVSVSNCSGQWSVAALPFNLSLLGNSGTPSPDKVVDAVCAIG
jgi:hypothetical protein